MTDLTSLSDLELQKLLAQHDYQSFTTLYNRYVEAVKKFLLKVLKSDELADDVSQEVFIKIWLNREQLIHVQVFKSYLFIVARNQALDYLRAAFRSDVAMKEIVQTFAEQRSTTEETLLDKEYLRFLNRVLNTLPQRSREIFALCKEQGKSYEEAASILGISRNAIKNHMVYTLKVFRYSTEKELGIPLSLLLVCLAASY